MSSKFAYHSAFSRNIGWVTPEEQAVLRSKRIAIAGMGGVGGIHLLTLARLGIEKFNIADFDVFDLANFNRQAGATLSGLNRAKVEVMAAMAGDINPELKLRTFPEGVNAKNLLDFLGDVDLYIDSLDFFAFDARQEVFSACAQQGIPAITAAPLGMGAAVLNFLPGKMTFQEYFRLNEAPEDEKAFRFLLGLSPAMLQRKYLVEPSAVNFSRRRGPSTIMACQLCAGMAATEAFKILLHRGSVLAAPRGLHFDAYRQKLVRTWRPWGNCNPIQRIAIAVAKRQLRGQDRQDSGKPESQVQRTVLEEILDVARWAPSGDNTQPWRFEIVDDHRLVVHGFDTREWCIYDYNGHPSHIAQGALLESIAIAATGHGLSASIARREDSPDNKPLFDVRLVPLEKPEPDPLLPYIQLRSVQRRSMSTRPLAGGEKRALEEAVGAEYHVVWLESFFERWRAARLMFLNGKLRLTLPEAYEVHKKVIERGARFSSDRIPDQAVGLDPMTTRLMNWVMQSWPRVSFFNTFLAGTIVPRLELDLLPSIACGAHFVILRGNKADHIDDYVDSGRALQRFWLRATSLGLQIQPEMTPLIFSAYVRDGVQFCESSHLQGQATAISQRLERLVGANNMPRVVVMGRIGAGNRTSARSTRLSLEQLKWV